MKVKDTKNVLSKKVFSTFMPKRMNSCFILSN